MRRILFLFGTAGVVASSVLWLSLVVNEPAATALNAATPTAFPLPTEVFPMFPSQSIILTEEGDIIEVGGEIKVVEPRPLEVGELVVETDHFRFHAKQGYLPVDLEPFGLEAEEIFDYVSARLETTADTKTNVLFEPPDKSSCPSRGSTVSFADETMLPLIIIYADERTSHEQVLGVLAHEIGHVLQNVGRGRQWDSPHIALREGQATWAAGQYWHAWQDTPSFDASVRSYLDRATYLPLYQNVDLSLAYWGENCIEKRDILYTEWAAFIDFLLTTDGTDQLEALLRSSPREEAEIDGEAVVISRPADFEGVYGSALNQLEAAWLSYLMTQQSGFFRVHL